MNEAVAAVAQKVAKKRPPGPRLSWRRQARRIAAGVHLDGPGAEGKAVAPLGCVGGKARLIDGNERGDRRKRQLKARAHDGFGFDQEHDEGGESEVSHGQGLPVENNRAQHDERHKKGAFGADARAGGDVVELPPMASRADHFLIG